MTKLCEGELRAGAQASDAAVEISELIREFKCHKTDLDMLTK